MWNTARRTSAITTDKVYIDEEIRPLLKPKLAYKYRICENGAGFFKIQVLKGNHLFDRWKNFLFYTPVYLLKFEVYFTSRENALIVINELKAKAIQYDSKWYCSGIVE